MSQFAAILGPPGHAASPDVIDAIDAALAPLAPDGGARWQGDGAILLCHRLIVTHQDAAEAQPLSFEGQIWIAGDFRLDGRDALVSQLRQHGRTVAPDMPDSALVLHAWHVWGERCVTHLLGDFGFAIWDARERRLFAARDHFGVSLIHYATVDGALIVANGIRALLAHPALDRTPDRASIGDFLLFGHSLDPARGMYRAVRRLPPAHTLDWRGGEAVVRRYWSPPEPHVAEPRLSEAEQVARFDAVLGEAVADRLRTDRIAISLSGGIDSPLIAAMAVRHAAPGTRLDAYSVGFDWLIPDQERHFASVAARHLNIPFHAFSLDSASLDPPGGPWRMVPEPRFSLRVQGIELMMPAVRASGARLVLSGLGGDVLAATIPDYWSSLLRAGKLGRWAREGWAFRRHFGHRPPLRPRSAAKTPWPLPSWLRPDFVREQRLDARASARKDQIVTTDPRVGMATIAYWSELLAGLGPEGNGSPIKGASPFFDVRLLEAALALPPMPWLHRKQILRKVAEPMLPPAITRRRKSPLGGHGFFAAALHGYDPAAAALAQAGPIDDFVDRAALLALLPPGADMPGRDYTTDITNAAGMALWLRNAGT
jgi:asparagine synthase (glutamine-hydrolysing)